MYPCHRPGNQVELIWSPDMSILKGQATDFLMPKIAFMLNYLSVFFDHR